MFFTNKWNNIGSIIRFWGGEEAWDMILFINNLETKIEALSFEVSNISKQLDEANNRIEMLELENKELRLENQAL